MQTDMDGTVPTVIYAVGLIDTLIVAHSMSVSYSLLLASGAYRYLHHVIWNGSSRWRWLKLGKLALAICQRVTR
jgi:nitric oxide reductase large subunit